MEQLLVRIWPDAYKIAFAILRERGLAEDAAQEACASVLSSLPKLKNAAAFPSWSYKIVVHRALAIARKRPHLIDESAVDHDAASDWTQTIDLHAAMARLRPPQRAAIVLRYYAGFDSAQIAAALRIPASTVRFHLAQARRALHDALSFGRDTGEENVSDVR